MARSRSRQQSTGVPDRSAFGRAVVWLLVAVSAIRGLRRGPATELQHGTATPGTPNGASTGETRSAAVHRKGSDDQAESAGSGDGNASGTGSSRPGEQAVAPTQIPPTGWWQVTRRAFSESTSDNVGILAGGVAFFAFLAIPPALIAGLTLYGIVADPQTVARRFRRSAGLSATAWGVLWRPHLAKTADRLGRSVTRVLVMAEMGAAARASFLRHRRADSR
jgi:hypothetical protein